MNVFNSKVLKFEICTTENLDHAMILFKVYLFGIGKVNIISHIGIVYQIFYSRQKVVIKY